MNLDYSINSVSFASLGIFVSESSGVLDMLALKEPFAVNWPDANGEVVDLSRPRYEVRTIELTCFMVATSADNYVTQMSALVAQLRKAGTQRLRFTPVTGKPFVFEVYAPSGIAVKKKWRDSEMYGEFTLKLIEPQPVKWVLTGHDSVSLTITAISPIQIHWGDGSTDTVMGVSQTVTHTYGGTGGTLYYAIVAGELDAMSATNLTNLTELWPRL